MTITDILVDLEAKAENVRYRYRFDEGEFIFVQPNRILALVAYVRKLEETKNPLYEILCKSLIARILEADANCDPPHDIGLRLEAIIRERDSLREDASKRKW